MSGEPSPRELASLVSRTEGLQPWRRVFHLANGLVLAWVPLALDLSRGTVVGILAGALAILVAGDVARLRSPRLNALFFHVFRPLASPREAREVASSTWYALGALLVYAIFPREAVIPAILVLAVADPVASVVGRTWGRRPLGKGSVIGTCAFFVTAITVLQVSVGRGTLSLLAVALVVTVVEVLPVPLDDNLTIPVATAVLLHVAGVVGG